MYFYTPFTMERQNTIYILSVERGDVNGDRIPDTVYLVGTKPVELPSGFFDDITILIQDGRTGLFGRIVPEANIGYIPRLILGDFTGDGVNDIYIAIASGGSGGFGYFYVYSYLNNQQKTLFDFRKFNQQYEYEVQYKDQYKVDVINKTLKEKYIIDISGRSKDYLDEIYDEDGKLRFPIEGQVLGVADVYPVDLNGDQVYDLIAFQRIIGRYNADSLGYVEYFLKWNAKGFTPFNQWVAIYGNELTI